jgi:hypothetical protein
MEERSKQKKTNLEASTVAHQASRAVTVSAGVLCGSGSPEDTALTEQTNNY